VGENETGFKKKKSLNIIQKYYIVIATSLREGDGGWIEKCN
jgi:hypothetical protein